MNAMVKRCPWCEKTQIERDYHDNEWGVPVIEDRPLFAKFVLDGAQAGLSWITILRKQKGYFKAFEGFEIEKVANFGEEKIQALLGNPGIVRNRAKIRGAVHNAGLVLKIQEGGESFSDLLWSFVDNKPVINTWKRQDQMPATSPQSDAMSKALKKMGFKFAGSTICYAFMQAVGMVNDHMISCFRHAQVTELMEKIGEKRH